MARIFIVLSLMFFSWGRAIAQAPEVVTEAKVFEVNRSRLKDLGIPPRAVSAERLESDFIINVSESSARALASGPGSRLLQSFQLTTVGENPAQFRIASRVAATNASAESQRLDVGFDFRLMTRVSQKREIAMTIISQAKIRSVGSESDESVSPISGQAIRHEITTAEGASVAAGGFITEADSGQLSKIGTLRDSPVLNYLFLSGNGTEDQPELVVVLTPRIVRFSDAPAAASVARAVQPSVPKIIDVTPKKKGVDISPKKPENETVRFTFTVQVGAFTTEAKARGIAAELNKKYPDAYVDTLETAAEGRPRYRIRVGHFPNYRLAKELEGQLRRDGFDPFVATLY
jgi:Flp pilus assembly secretin CpaC